MNVIDGSSWFTNSTACVAVVDDEVTVRFDERYRYLAMTTIMAMTIIKVTIPETEAAIAIIELVPRRNYNETAVLV
jgi:hypothetical protein